MIKTHRYASGLRLVMEKIPSVRSVSIGVWIGAGSKHETPDNNGISHFIEHMLFKGTTTRSARDIAEAFDSIGGHLNAFTSKECTCYYAKVLDQHVEYAFDVLSDMFFNATFSEEELEKEKNVVIEELHMYEDTPDDVVHDLIAEATYKNHSLGYNILGRKEVLQKLTPEDLRRYMDQYYTPENTVIAVAGNIDENQMIRLTETYFDRFKNQHKPKKQPLPRVTSEHLLKVKDTEQAHLCIGLEGLPLGDSKLYALILLNNILGGSMSSRLFQQIREEKGLAYSVFSYHSCFQETGSLHIYAGTSVHQVEQVYELCTSILHDLAQNGVTEKELRNGKEQLKGHLMLSLESTNSRMSRIARNELLLNRHLTLDQIVAGIDAITLDDVHQLASRLFKQKHSFALVSPLEHIPDSIHPEQLLV
ncbi:peptidase M16 domain protein [Caldalkalibacillus thermarum TA2.A1]|uniref:Peptidase M16 domain protein n=1 Tax=Caldalkalibacillus thermarum (strain TA2.A1) TaxID=986075 RepID=F5L9T4_CALTT|nr:pitrilysin family protein [Caldalkalibacillus thermarum]EGL81933.1 peptidase M16 domain protein [Caldalkalibacillus thermarum TA2.A1]